MVSSAKVDSQATKVFSATLKGASRVLDVRLEPGGALVLGLNKSVRLEVRPDDFSVGPDYSLYLGSHSYHWFDGKFVEEEQSSPEDLLELE